MYKFLCIIHMILSTYLCHFGQFLVYKSYHAVTLFFLGIGIERTKREEDSLPAGGA